MRNTVFQLCYPLEFNSENLNIDIVKELHKNSQGFISSSTIQNGKMNQKFFHVDNFEYEKNNSFFSINTFSICCRKAKCLKELTAFYIDLDYYKNCKLSRKQIIWQLENDVFGKEIPFPTWLVSSGYGLYYILAFENPIIVRNEKTFNFELVQKWNKCMKFLYESLKDYGADRRALDVSRVLRIPATKNMKHGQMRDVEVVRNYNNKISMEEFIQLWLPESQQKELKKINVQKNINEKIKENGIKYGKSLKNLNYNRMKDMERLVNMRDGDCEGQRNNILHIYSYFHLLANDGNIEKLKNEIKDFNNCFIKKEKEAQIRATLRTCYKAYKDYKTGERIFHQGKWYRKGYNYKNETLIELLEITEEEQKKLKSIKSKEMVRKNRNEKRKKERRDENGFLRSEIEKQEMLKQILELKKMGLNNSQIAKNVNMSRQTVLKYLKMEGGKCYENK